MFESPENLAWPILFLPLGSAVAITLLTRRLGKFSALISIVASPSGLATIVCLSSRGGHEGYVEAMNK